jgi:hypothetical protein
MILKNFGLLYKKHAMNAKCVFYGSKILESEKKI